MSTDGCMANGNVVHAYKRILCSLKNKKAILQDATAWTNMESIIPRGNKPAPDGQILQSHSHEFSKIVQLIEEKNRVVVARDWAVNQPV